MHDVHVEAVGEHCRHGDWHYWQTRVLPTVTWMVLLGQIE